jgi:hypothetical protein
MPNYLREIKITPDNLPKQGVIINEINIRDMMGTPHHALLIRHFDTKTYETRYSLFDSTNGEYLGEYLGKSLL